MLKPPSSSPKSQAERQRYRTAVAPEAVEVKEDHLLFPGGVMLPLTMRGSGLPGAGSPWTHLSADFFTASIPAVYSITLRRELPDTLARSLRSRRTLFEGLLLAAAEKTGRRPSMAEQSKDRALDAAESGLAMGQPAYRVALLAALYASRPRAGEADAIRRMLESGLRAKGLTPQRLYYVAERALRHLQPGGELFSGLDGPTLFLDEILSLLPTPSRQVLPSKDAVWVGRHAREGRDVYFSYSAGLDPTAPAPTHALTLILGEMGSGKTSLMRSILLQRLMHGRTVLSIDPEGENNDLCKTVGGRVIPAGAPEDRATCLLHPLQAEDPAEMLLAVRFLIAALGGEAALTPGVQAALHEAVRRRWDRRPGPMALADLVEALATVNAPETAVPMALLRPYAQGGLWDGFFDRPDALLDPNFPPGEWWNFDLSSLRAENQAIVHAILAWFLYHTVTVGKKPMDIFVDEGWRLLRSGPFAELLDELGRRARKRDIGVTLITHLPADLTRSPTSLSMASTAFIGRLGPDEAFAFFRSLGVPEGEARRTADQVSRLPPYTFLAAPSGGRGALFPVSVIIPPVWLDLWKAIGAAGREKP